MTPVFYKTVLEQNPALRRAEVRDAAALEQINGVVAAVPAAHAGVYAKAMQKVKAAQQEQRELVTEQQGQVEVAEENAAVMSDMVALPAEASQGESLVLAQASQAQREAPAPKSKSANSPEDEGFGIAWQGGIAALGLFALGGGSSTTTTVAESDEHDCDLEVSIPTRPSSTGALIFSAGPGGEDSGSAVYSASHQSIILTADMLGSVSADITSSVDIGDIYASAVASGQVQASVVTTGSVGDIALVLGESTRESGGADDLVVSAGGDIGDVSFITTGISAGGTLRVSATGGDIGDFSVLASNPSGQSHFYISAFAEASGDELVGGNVGDLTFKLDTVTSQVRGNVYARGGDVGTIDICLDGMSAETNIYVSAIAQINGSGEVVGGNVGDIQLDVSQRSGGGRLEVHAVAVTDVSGNVLGGGNIGNIVLTSDGAGEYDAATASLFAVDGGNIGNLTVTTVGGINAETRVDAFVNNGGDVGDIRINTLGSGSHSASAQVQIYLMGTDSNASVVGDITLDLYGGQNCSAAILIDSFTSDKALYAHIGDITAVNHGGGSGEIDIFVDAGSGSVIGNVSLTDNGRFSQHRIELAADDSIGDVTATLGGGSGHLWVRVESQSGTGLIGSVDIDVASDNYAAVSGGEHAVYLEYQAVSGTTVSGISISGGSEFATLNIVSNRVSAEVIGDLNLSGFAGFSFIDLSSVLEGVRIDVSQGGSLIIGSQASDEIDLGDGGDTINFGYFDSGEGVDDIFNYQAGVDALDVYDTGSTDFVDLIGNTATTIADGSVVSLVDLAGGDDLSTASGLLDALNGGEYALVDSTGVGKFTFVTASSNASDSFNVYEVSHVGRDYTSAYLMATVDFKTGSTFGDLTASDFV